MLRMLTIGSESLQRFKFYNPDSFSIFRQEIFVENKPGMEEAISYIRCPTTFDPSKMVFSRIRARKTMMTMGYSFLFAE
jgi:hypothetical protein